MHALRPARHSAPPRLVLLFSAAHYKEAAAKPYHRAEHADGSHCPERYVLELTRGGPGIFTCGLSRCRFKSGCRFGGGCFGCRGCLCLAGRYVLRHSEHAHKIFFRAAVLRGDCNFQPVFTDNKLPLLAHDSGITVLRLAADGYALLLVRDISRVFVTLGSNSGVSIPALSVTDFKFAFELGT